MNEYNVKLFVYSAVMVWGIAWGIVCLIHVIL